MPVINFGSCCIDNVYSVPHFVQPGETLPATGYAVHPGGKGLNQSLAMAYAGAEVRHAGRVGRDGLWMKELLASAGVDTRRLKVVDQPTGHANIQVTPCGENAIVSHGGANRTITPDDVEEVLGDASPGGVLLLQNEISCLPDIIESAGDRGLKVVFNAAPITAEVSRYPLERIDTFILNEHEAADLSGQRGVDGMLDALLERFPASRIVLTLGEQGAVYQDRDAGRITQPGFSANAVDTTGAGDTFTGYFVAGLVADHPIEDCLRTACLAAALCVTRPGAASSIPRRDELANFTPGSG